VIFSLFNLQYVSGISFLLQQSQAELEKMEEVLREKIRENNRLKDSFETIKQANEGLRKQVSSIHSTGSDFGADNNLLIVRAIKLLSS
jgi:hypothetical protein